jgi:hypothetical protein
MFPHRMATILALTLGFAPLGAQAFIDPPWVTPMAPRADEIVSVNFRMGECDARVEHPGYPQVTRQGNAIRLLVYGHHWETQDLCIYPVGTGTEPIGGFPPGDYNVTVDFAYENYHLGLTVITLGVIPFTVAGVTSATPVPALTAPSQLALLTFAFGSALLALRMRRRNRC